MDDNSPEAQARRAETQRRQTALKAWNPNDMPDWLDRSYYEAKIQSLLSNIPVARTMAAIAVSEPYALDFSW